MGSTSGKKKPYIKAAIFGIVSIALYVTLLNKQEFLNGTFSKGGLYAFLPIVTAFIFSFFHGSFTGHFWTVLSARAQ